MTKHALTLPQVPSVDTTGTLAATSANPGSLVFPAPSDYFGAIQACRTLGGSMTQWTSSLQVRPTEHSAVIEG